MKTPFINERTGAVHFPGDKEETHGTSQHLPSPANLADSVQPVTRFDFIESTPMRQLELIATELEKLRDWSAEREMELECGLERKPHPMKMALADAFSLSANELESVAQKMRYAISECYSAWGRQFDD
jgi:hypothetical protein